ncbi:MAG: DUF3990 domain-containing protein [Clostridia bacterium]|nr:DUF3990 domain-containing protein [Clostridia bacterium]
MIELHDEMLLYHGSYIGIPEIDLDRCFSGLDFGRGFYLTSSYEQAYHYVQLSVRKAIRIGTVSEDFNPNDGQISVYKFHYDPNILAYYFQGASVEWLHFVAANRKKDLFPQLIKKYSTIDIIGGKIADDQTARTLQRYISGADFGVPGTPEADREAIKKLLPNRLQDQFCFRTQDAIDHLEFIRSDRYGDIKL